MPYLAIRTNLTVDIEKQQAFASQASSTVSGLLDKSETYVMTSIEHCPVMTFAGTADACAYIELKSIGLPENRTSGISEALCNLVEEGLGVPAGRIYIEFTNARGNMWGWNKSTF